jgi:hypothetical protein
MAHILDVLPYLRAARCGSSVRVFKTHHASSSTSLPRIQSHVARFPAFRLSTLHVQLELVIRVHAAADAAEAMLHPDGMVVRVISDGCQALPYTVQQF